MADGDYTHISKVPEGSYKARDLTELDRLTCLARKTGRRLEDRSRALIRVAEEVLEIGEEAKEFYQSYQNK